MSYVLPLSELKKSDVSIAGGKGANLGEMIAAGFPVPAGFVLTTKAYDAFVQAGGLQQPIADWAGAVVADDPRSGEAAAAEIERLFLEAAVPADIHEALLVAYGELGGDVGQSALPVAVRSSATAEDMPDASFAGQHETYLNKQGEEALLAAVKKCWASLWTARAMAYRRRQKIDPDDVSLAVIVQELVPADVSGILFTANPVTGQRDQLLINATWGLGEAIVGGQVTPDTVLVAKSTWEILSRETATKTIMTARTGAGTEVQAVPPALQTQPSLADQTAVSLAKLGAAIEAHYQTPMDVEWAIADDKITILQARPISSLPDPGPEPLADVVWEPIVPNTVWMRRQIVEHMPEPVSPLFEDLYLRQGLTGAMNRLLDELAEISKVRFDFDAMIPHGFAGTINGYAYTTGSFTMRPADVVGVLRIYGQMPKFLNMRALDWDDVVLPGYQALIARWGAIELTEATDEDLLLGIAELAAADGFYWFGSAAELGFSRLLDPLFDRLLKSPLIRHALPESRRASAAFLRGFDSQALDAQADLEGLASMIRTLPAMRELVLNTEASQLFATLAGQPDGKPVLAGLRQYLDRYGHQIYNLDFAEPTQAENPLPMVLSLKALVENAPAQDIRSRQARMAEEREALVAQTEEALNPLSRWVFRQVWKWTKARAPGRENVMFYMGAAWPTLRKLAGELGQRLTDAGAIALPDDIYFLDSREIAGAIAARGGGQPVPSLAGLAQERRVLREARRQLTPLPKVPARGSLKFGPINLSMFDPTPSDVIPEGPVLNGFAVSTGRVTAPASVIRSVTDFDRMQPGTILVCSTTTPAWTPLFSQAVGLVTDVGGALAHGSIVAREYGIPAVMGTGVATDRVKSGMMLTVDGHAGTVTLVDEVDPAEEAKRRAQEQAERGAAARRRRVMLAIGAGMVAGYLWWRNRK